MADWPIQSDGGRHGTGGLVAGSTNLTNVASAASAHVKGSWVQLTAGVAFPVKSLLLYVAHVNNQEYLIDVGIGGSGSEQIVINNFYHAVTTVGHGNFIVYPVDLPPNTRIAARCQANAASKSTLIGVALWNQGFLPSNPMQRLTTYGADTANTRGTTVDPGATANAKGSWYQITASTAKPIKWLYFNPGFGGTAPAGNTKWFVDIGVGGAGSEVIVVPDIHTIATGRMMGPIGPYPLNIPAGSRIAARAQCSVASATMSLVLQGAD